MLLNRDRANDVMDRHGLVGLVAREHVNVFYLTDYWAPGNEGGWNFGTFAVLPRREDFPAAMVVSATALERLADLMPTWVPNLVPYSDYSGRIRMKRGAFDPGHQEPKAAPWNGWPVRPGANLTVLEQKWVDQVARHANRMTATPAWGLKRALVEAGLGRGRVGTDDPRLLHWMKDMGLPDIEVVDATNVFREIRLVKTAEEITRLRKAAKINEASTEVAIRSLHEGATWDEIVAVYNLAITKAGGRPKYLITSLGGLAHGHVVRGEPMLFDALGEYQHYLGDFGRIAVVGEASDELKRRARAMEEGLRAGLAVLRPGLKRSVLIDTVISATRKAGFPEFFYVSPHSLGLEHTDNPMPMGPEVFDDQRDLELLENMVFNIDMPYFEHGWGTLHIEDTVRITRTGFEPLTSLKTEVRVVA